MLAKTLIAACCACTWLSAMAQAQTAEAKPAIQTVDGLRAVTLRRSAKGPGPQFLSLTVLPDHGMDLFQITAQVPGRGETNVLASPSLSEAARKMEAAPGSAWSYTGYGFGAAILLPWASRIRGTAGPDGTLLADWHGHTLRLHANSGGSSVHGLLERAHVEDLRVQQHGRVRTLTGTIHAGDFGGHWIGNTDVYFAVSLTSAYVDVEVKAKNVGHDPLPMAIGWHPYFALPSGQRAEARLHVEANQFAETQATGGLPTGVLKAVAGSKFDFRAAGGAALPSDDVNVNLSGLKRGTCTARLTDTAARYGLRVCALSSEIRTVQVYSPRHARFVAIEPQFNLSDALGSEWAGRDTGIMTLMPGQTAVWHVRLELFQPH